MASQSTSAPSGPPKSKGGKFPTPLVFAPNQSHKQTFIILHGRGSTAQKFAPPLLETTTPSGDTLQTTFPHAKLIFLTASMNRAVIYKRASTHQWFDHWHMHDFYNRQDLMVPGLYKSCNYIHGVLQEEIDVVGRKNVVLWGLSMGSATSLMSLLAWDGEPFVAVVGMCGYLPFGNCIKDVFEKSECENGDGEEDGGISFAYSDDEDGDDNFSRGDDEVDRDLPLKAVTILKEKIDMDEKQGMVFRDIPVFLGHGDKDEKVDIKFGREAEDCLEILGVGV